MLALIVAFAAGATPAIATSPIIERNRFVVDKFYPAESALRGEQGRVLFRIRTNRKGQVDACQVIASSGYKRLDEASCDMILRGATAKTLLNGDGDRIGGYRDAFVDWKLPAQFAMINAPAFDIEVGSIGMAYNCHRQPRKNSVIIEEKICVSDKEWARQVEYAQAETMGYQRGNGPLTGF